MQPVEHQSTATRERVQHGWSSTSETGDVLKWEAPSKLLAVDNTLLLPEREVPEEIGITWFFDQDILSHLKARYVRTLAESLLWEEHLVRTR